MPGIFTYSTNKYTFLTFVYYQRFYPDIELKKAHYHQRSKNVSSVACIIFFGFYLPPFHIS